MQFPISQEVHTDASFYSFVAMHVTYGALNDTLVIFEQFEIRSTVDLYSSTD